jgi:hypothetical protein
MSRAVIVATGDLDHLPQEIQTVSNVLNAAGWKVQLCLGPDASRAGLLAAAGEGDVDLAWFGLHSGAEGFALSDGVWPPAQLGTWLRNVNACECVLNSCYSVEHVEAIQRAADGVGVACTVSPAGVDDALAWQVGVHLVRAYVVSGDMRAAVARASGQGVLQYRYVPAGGLVVGGGRRMPADRIEEQLQQLLRALYGENANAVPGLVARVGEIQSSLRQMADEQQRWHEEQRDWRERTERRLDMLERPKPIIVTERAVYISGAVITLTLGVLLLWVLLLNGRFG